MTKKFADANLLRDNTNFVYPPKFEQKANFVYNQIMCSSLNPERHQMSTDILAFFLYPPVWVIKPPPAEGPSPISVDVRAMEDEVYRRKIPGGIEVKVTRDGLFVFDFSSWARCQRPPEVENMVDFDEEVSGRVGKAEVMNAYLVCLYSAIIRIQRFNPEKMTVTLSDMIAMRSFDSRDMVAGSLKCLPWVQARYPSQYPSTIPPGLDWRILARSFAIEKPTLDQSFELLEAILKRPYDTGTALTALLNSACKTFEDHDYWFSLVVSWSLSEKILQSLFESYVDANREKAVEGKSITFINAERRKKLLDGRDFTASVVIEILSFLDVFPLQLYNDLSRVRRARNNWIHNLKPVSRKEAELGVNVAVQLFRELTGIDLCLSLVLHIHGIDG